MPSARAACAICMESLFSKLDDLDQIVPATAPDCGHVFHEPCLKEWFQTQSEQYLATAREHRLDRDPSPTLSDAPAFCPSCRTECFADQETGEPALHRLYINFDDGHGGSSQAGSSPIRPALSRRREDEEVMGIARRAKGLREEATGLGHHATEEDVNGFLKQAEGLKDDAASVKAVQGIKTYVGGLTTAINSFRSTLAHNPLATTLRERVDTLEDALNTMASANKDMTEKTIPAMVKRAKLEERAAADKRVEKIRAEKDLITRGLEREQVQKREIRKAAEEREQHLLKDLQSMKRALNKEEEEREALQETLRERTKNLRAYQAKSESKKELKEKLDQLEKENQVLRGRLESETPANRPRRTTAEEHSPSPNYPDMEDAEAGPSHRRLLLPATAYSQTIEDDSLELIMPPSTDTESQAQQTNGKLPTRSASGPRQHPTARTFSYNMDDTSSGGAKKRKPQRSKYFSGNERDDHSEDIDRSHSDAGDDEVGDESEIIIQPSSTPVRPSPMKRSRTNPFSTTREAQTAKTKLMPKKITEVIDLASSSPRSPFKPNTTNIPEPSRQRNALTDLMKGMTDKNGRPKKGLASGAKVRHRA